MKRGTAADAALEPAQKETDYPHRNSPRLPDKRLAAAEKGPF
jgi:hypothetical protein